MEQNSTKIIMVYRSGEFAPTLIMHIDRYEITEDGDLTLFNENDKIRVSFEWSYFNIYDYEEVFKISNNNTWDFR